ncbi:MAG: hypothetical protein HBSAPP02_26490 [Phycisphaerae bacterium]|nr:MAG: SDR family oxidoreductase [Planctomycetia bacterium]RIK71083.1 MAG: hypothetical protein DCC66_02625 [Planctomycetota bacterium]GJQ27617.1 MAG: hypothetical protein HBSAPP02_26490 [Phycisphaerae bacterium]
MIDQSPTTFLTGATGFLGHYLLRDLLRSGRRMVVMLRAPLIESRERLTKLMRPLEIDLNEYIDADQLVLVAGALPDELPEPTWGRTDEIVACAACLQLLANGNQEPHRTNVLGTQSIIEWAERHGCRSIHAVSTAYVCGYTQGTVREVFHYPQPTFQTDYERSKWIAEDKLREWSNLPERSLTVYRPSFLVGDSANGYTTQFGGFYQFARLVSLLKEQNNGNNGHTTYVPLRIPGYPTDQIQNLVPVDFASKTIARIMDDPAFHGRIYHVADPSPPTWEFFKACMEDYFGLHGGYFVPPEEIKAEVNTPESLMWEKYDLLLPRLRHLPRFDCSNTLAFLASRGLTFPSFDRDRITTLLDYARSRNWGTRSGRLARAH